MHTPPKVKTSAAISKALAADFARTAKRFHHRQGDAPSSNPALLNLLSQRRRGAPIRAACNQPRAFGPDGEQTPSKRRQGVQAHVVTSSTRQPRRRVRRRRSCRTARESSAIPTVQNLRQRTATRADRIARGQDDQQRSAMF